jgi:branched-chain amino acid transport system ATP-binding protein
MTAILEVSGLVAGYGKKTVVRGIDLAVAEREIVTILGHNGAGKTTLLRTVFGLAKPSAGRVRLAARDITGRAPSLNIADGLAMVPQGHGIFRTLSVLQNLELGGFEIASAQVRAERLDRVFGLFPLLKERVRQIGGTMSGGQQQMLAIGMALMSEPRVLLLDEPSIGLAPALVERVMQSIREINATHGTTIVLVEQNLKHGLAVAHRAVVLNRGEKRFDGDPMELRDERRLLALF